MYPGLIALEGVILPVIYIQSYTRTTAALPCKRSFKRHASMQLLSCLPGSHEINSLSANPEILQLAVAPGMKPIPYQGPG